MRKSIHSESEMVKAVKELESGVSVEVVAREHGISKATLYQWKSKYSGMDVIEKNSRARGQEGVGRRHRGGVRSQHRSGVLLDGHPQVILLLPCPAT